MHVLIADDDPIIGSMLRGVFEKKGWTVRLARDGMQSVMYAMGEPKPDIILLDVNMPGGSGLHVLERIKASTKSNLIPVLVVTGSTDPGLAAKVAELGAAGFIEKPVEPAALMEEVQRIADLS